MGYYKDLKEAHQLIAERDARLGFGQLPSYHQGYFAHLFAQKRLEKANLKKSQEKEALSSKAEAGLDLFKKEQDEIQFIPGQLLHDDGFDVDKSLDALQKTIDNMPAGYQKDQAIILKERTESVSNLSEALYARFDQNPNALKNWFPQLQQATKKVPFFKVPESQTWDLPIELAEYLRFDYLETTQRSRHLFNSIIKDHFQLKQGHTYFLRCGEFSSKFQFANTKCTNPDEAGEQFHLISNFAMQVGAGRSNDITVREYIEDPENNPTIYNGLPLRTEFRSFIDLDKKKLIGIVPYWNPLVMERTLETQQTVDADIKKDYQTYLKMEDKLMTDYNSSVPVISKNLKPIIDNFKGLTGKWSLDIMKSGSDYYLIDMATMETSALTELIGKGISKIK